MYTDFIVTKSICFIRLIFINQVVSLSSKYRDLTIQVPVLGDLCGSRPRLDSRPIGLCEFHVFMFFIYFVLYKSPKFRKVTKTCSSTMNE